MPAEEWEEQSQFLHDVWLQVEASEPDADGRVHFGKSYGYWGVASAFDPRSDAASSFRTTHADLVLLNRQLRILPANGSREEFEVTVTGIAPGRHMDLAVSGKDEFGVKWTHIQYDCEPPQNFRADYVTKVQFHGYLCRFSRKERDHMEVYFYILPESDDEPE